MLFAVLVAVLGGCGGSEAPPEAPAELPLKGVELKLAVVDDPALAEAIGRLRGEWTAQTGSELTVSTLTEQELLDASGLKVDAVIAPSWQLGPLAERKLIAPLPNQRAFERGEAAGWADVFELLRLREAAWGNRVMGVPFGSPVLVVYYRADLLRKLGRRPPETWAEYRQLAELLADREKLGDAAPPAEAPWAGTIEPLAPGWAGLALLARAAPYARNRSNYSTLFDINSFDPLIADPPFLRALTELVDAAKFGPSDPLKYDLTLARAAFWRGECGMALTWPTAAAEGLPSSDERPAGLEVGFAELPGSDVVFDTGTRKWNPRTDREDHHVPLLSVAGRLGMLSSQSKHEEATTQLLLWLSGPVNGPMVCTSSAATTLCRKEHVKAAAAWVERPVPAETAVAYGEQTQRTLGRQLGLAALPLPGRQQYLAALDEAVQAAVRGDQIPMEALSRAASRWRAINRERGEQQKAAYLHSLGL